MDSSELARAETELASLPRKCEAVLESSALSPSRETLMKNRVAALRIVLKLVVDARSRSEGQVVGDRAVRREKRASTLLMINEHAVSAMTLDHPVSALSRVATVGCRHLTLIEHMSE